MLENEENVSLPRDRHESRSGSRMPLAKWRLGLVHQDYPLRLVWGQANTRWILIMATVRVLILRGPGSNCDAEAQFAFEQAGAIAERIHINRLRESPKLIQRFQV